MGSQASQDLFVLGMLGQPATGYYLEIGASHPVEFSNTFLLEQRGWKGLSIDILEQPEWSKHRKNRLVVQSAVKFNYHVALHHLGFPKFIDYLSLDIDEHTNDAMKWVPFEDYQFKVITIEHDAYRFGDKLRTEQRKYLEDRNYFRLCSDVNGPIWPFEDWYVHNNFYLSSMPTLSNVMHDEIIKAYGFL